LWKVILCSALQPYEPPTYPPPTKWRRNSCRYRSSACDVFVRLFGRDDSILLCITLLCTSLWNIMYVKNYHLLRCFGWFVCDNYILLRCLFLSSLKPQPRMELIFFRTNRFIYRKNLQHCFYRYVYLYVFTLWIVYNTCHKCYKYTI